MMNKQDEIANNSTEVNNDKNALKMINYLKNISNNVNGLISLIEKEPDNNLDKENIINEISKNIINPTSENSNIIEETNNLEKNNEETINNNILNNDDTNIEIDDIKNEEANATTDDYVLAALPKENTLIISYLDSKVVLPFTIDELENIQKENPEKYSTALDVFDDLYLKDIKYYKNTSIARFRETFKLVREREHGSLKDAILLSLEVFTNYNIYPAVISACKNVNEFDVYLSCLEYNELEDFHFFNIEFVIPPVESNSKNELISKLQNLFKPKNMRRSKH